MYLLPKNRADNLQVSEFIPILFPTQQSRVIQSDSKVWTCGKVKSNTTVLNTNTLNYTPELQLIGNIKIIYSKIQIIMIIQFLSKTSSK